MRIQEVRFHETTEKELWYRSHGEIKNQEGTLIFEKNAGIVTNTYYHAFSLEKWNTYCDFQKTLLKMTYSGSFEIKIYLAKMIGDEPEEQLLYTEVLSAPVETEFTFALPKQAEGVVYFALEAQKEGACLKEAFYEGVCEKEKEVNIALNICTFKREKELLENLRLIKETFLENKEEPLSGHLKVFVTDNGKTLDTGANSGEDIFLFQNENVGGAGGFTRGLCEINKVKKEEKITHVIFMDDDIELEPEALRRTYVMLRALREQYAGAFIAGAMLRADNRNVQYENGAWWRCGKLKVRQRDVRMDEFPNVVRNEQIEDIEYAAWWYCCVPIAVVNEQNLPLPVFIHGDDIEYSLRNTNCVITLNGVAVRHPVITHKCTSANIYYDVRNTLIVNSCCYKENYKAIAAKKMIFQALANALLKYRYKDMHLICQAVEDFCAGAEWLLKLDAVSYHQKVQKLGYEFLDVTEIVGEAAKQAEAYDKGKMPGPLTLMRQAGSFKKKLQMLLQIISLNGWLLPAKKETGVFYMNVHPMFLYRKKKAVLFNDESMQGIVVEKSFQQLFTFLKLALKINALIDKNFIKSKESYQASFNQLTSIAYWRENYHY